jgi:hypothetical protein
MKTLELVTDMDNSDLKKEQENNFLLSLLKNKIFITLRGASYERENSFAAVKVLKFHSPNLMYDVFNISRVAMTTNKTHR